MVKKYLICVLVCSILIGALPVFAQEGESPSCVAVDPDFLAAQGLLAADAVTQEDFSTVMLALTGTDPEDAYPPEIDGEGFTALEALLTTVYYLNVDELGYTYPVEKIEAALADWNVSALDAARQSEFVAAVDTGLLEDGCAAVDLMAEATPEFVNYLYEKALVFSGQYKHYLGYATDADIYNQLWYAWNSFDQVSAPDFQAYANDLIVEGVITGYNIKRSALDAGFIPERTIVYGHSNIAHAIQLIGLLRSEDMAVKIQLEPKTSAYLYLAEWGEPWVSPEFQVEPLDDGNYIAFAKEYDLVLEFDDMDDYARFDAIIKAYAKKNEADQPNLLYGSWWQPLYSTVEAEDYIAVKNNIATAGGYYIQAFSLVENSEAVSASFADAFPESDVAVVDLYVNEAFYNYLLGEAQ